MERLPTHFGFIAVPIRMFPVPKSVNTSTYKKLFTIPRLR